MRPIIFILLALPLFASVVTEPVIRGDLFSSQRFNGTLSFNQKSRLAAESDGLITQLYFDEGDYVKKGTLLLKTDSQIIDAQIKSTKASIKASEYALQKAELDFKRYATLLEKESISQQKYDEFYFRKLQLEQELISLKASLQAQTIAKAKKAVYAPFSGQIAQRNVQVGEWLKEGTQVALLINPSVIDATFYLPSTYIHTLSKKTGPDVRINDKTYKSRFIGKLLSGDIKTRTFPLKLRLLDTDTLLFDGMQAQLDLEKSRNTQVLLVPRDSLIKRFGKDVVFIIKDNKAQMLQVEVISYEENKIAVSSTELNVGDQVITKGNERIRPGQEINP